LVARPKCLSLYLNYRKHQFIIDDESYFTLSNANLSGNDTFYSNDRNMTANDVKYYDKAKYEEKVLVWLSMSPAGLIQFYIVTIKMTVNQKVYLEECLKKRLLPFIKKYHKGGKYVFWPDMDSSHYANLVQEWLVKEKIPFIPKSMNVANVPEIRPIEDLLSFLKRQVYKDSWQAKNIDQLKNKIAACIRNIDVKVVQKLAESTIRRIDVVRRFGVR